jgi:trans-aconitate 2-methyltransferase
MWSPEQYRLFSDERSVPFHDLMSRVELLEARRVADLGCGSGELTASLLKRWPEARIWGVDSSPEMIEAAAAHAVPGHLSFEVADLAAWSAPEPLDLIVANASLHWVGEHEVLLPKLVNTLGPGGVLAFQVPANFEAPSHRLIAELSQNARWSARLGMLAEKKVSVQAPGWYLAYLLNLGLSPKVWETTYYHVLQGEDPVMEWTAGTALRPVLATLDAHEQAEFKRQYAAALREAYPKQAFGTIFPFRRIFAVARK